MPILEMLFQNIEEDRTCLNSFYNDDIIANPEKKRYQKKEKLYTNIFYNHICNYLQQNIKKRGVPVVVQWKQILLVSMRMHI